MKTLKLTNRHIDINVKGLNIMTREILLPNKLALSLLLFILTCAQAQAQLSLPSPASTFSAAGRATSNGAGIAGVTITFERTSGTGALPSAATTDKDGNWSQTGFVSGTTYKAVPSKEDYIFSPGSATFSTKATLQFVGVSAVPTAPTTFKASGRVTIRYSPDPGVEIVFVRSGSGSAPSPVRTDANGNWSQTGFIKGVHYSVEPRLPGWSFQSQDLSVKRYPPIDLYSASPTLAEIRDVNFVRITSVELRIKVIGSHYKTPFPRIIVQDISVILDGSAARVDERGEGEILIWFFDKTKNYKVRLTHPDYGFTPTEAQIVSPNGPYELTFTGKHLPFP